MKKYIKIISFAVFALFQFSLIVAQEPVKTTKEGCVSGNCVNGKGKFVSSNYTYEGDWKNGIKEGQGIYSNFLGEVYTGQFVNDKFEGKGKLDSGTGIYIGDFVSGKKEGKGTMTTAVYIYTGDWKNGKKEGFGKITKLITKSVQEGKFLDGKFIP